MSEGRVRFNPEFNLGHVGMMIALCGSAGAAWYGLNSRVDQMGHGIERMEKVLDTKADKEIVGRGEVELSRRIVETQREQNNAMTRIDEGFREVKAMLSNMDRKLDNKVDKPGR